MQATMLHEGTYIMTHPSSKPAAWLPALYNALPICLFVLGLFYYWFGVANRYDIFLYGHVAKGIPTTQPFDALTSSRYWMAGLVCGGIVMVLYTAAHWLLARLRRQHIVPDWWRVWVCCLPALLVGIPLITMTTNTPTLPPLLALACTVATLAGLALALLPARLAAQQPKEVLWLALDGAGFMPCLMLMHAVELPGQGLSISPTAALGFTIGGILASIIWLACMTGLRHWRRRPQASVGAILAAGLCFSYLLLPLAHFVFATPVDHRYITSASNFFARSPLIQALTFLIAMGIAFGFSRLRKRTGQRATA
jgi:hypothetical protein